jgi:hypothetical protein
VHGGRRRGRSVVAKPDGDAGPGGAAEDRRGGDDEEGSGSAHEPTVHPDGERALRRSEENSKALTWT